MLDKVATSVQTDIDLDVLHKSLTDPALASMNFLNEVADWFPDAVSFAAGMPYEDLFEVDSLSRYLRTYCTYLQEERGLSADQVRRTLFQYGRTKGIIHELVARNLAIDEGIDADPEAVVVTVGCHEAMYLVLRALRRDDRDVVLAVTPTYVGFTGIAHLVDLPVLPVASGPLGIDFKDLAAQIRRGRSEGLRPRACYVMPDFANPTGLSMSLDTRRRLLAVAQAEGLLLLEDNPYGLFSDGPRARTLKALDTTRQVVYLGSFAKSGLPGARVGYVVADQRVTGGLFADQLATIKGSLTVNTSSIAQAMVGGKLLEHGCDLIAANAREIEVYRRNRKLVLDGLDRRFGRSAGEPGAVRWNSPSGGFFVVVDVPFAVDDALLEYSAREYGVLWTPMRYFYNNAGGAQQIRLSCSLLTPDRIDLGLDRLTALIRDRSG